MLLEALILFTQGDLVFFDGYVHDLLDPPMEILAAIEAVVAFCLPFDGGFPPLRNALLACGFQDWIVTVIRAGTQVAIYSPRALRAAARTASTTNVAGRPM